MKKQNKRSKLTRITLALLLILSMIGNTLILPAVAQESLTPTDETILPETPLDGTSDATGAATLPEPIQLTAADIPEFISAAALEERGAVERMRAEETNMSSVIFRNADGTRTMYMYGLPVKYTALDGTVRDKSTNLVSVSTASVLLSNQPVAQTMAQMSTTQRAALQEELGILDAERAATTLHMLSTALTTRGKSLSDMAYTTLDNDVYALFPTNLAQGMTLVFGEHSVRMTPAGNGLTVTAGGNVTKTTTASLADSDVAERLLYPNVFGLGTAVQYTPTLTGVKEEILLSRNVGKNSFAFLLETGGLILTEQSGQFTLVDPETEQKVGTLGEIIVFDSAGQIVRGSMTAQTILAGQKYGITISVDQEFLASATYPVSIDPTYHVNPFNQVDDKLIEDVSIYSDEDCVNYTFIEYHQIGTVIGGTYQGQAAYRIPALYDPSKVFDDYTSLTADRIGSVKLYVRSMMNTTSNSTLHVCQYGSDWLNTTKIFGSPYYDNDLISVYDSAVTNVSPNTTVEIDITNFAKEWSDYYHGFSSNSSFIPERGILLRYLSYPGSIWLEALEYNSNIYVTLEYSDSAVGDYYMNSRYTRTFLAADEMSETLELRSGLVSTLGNSIKWTLEYCGNSQYYLHPGWNQTLCLDMWGDFTTDKNEETRWTQSLATGGGVIWTCDDGAVLAVDEDGDVFIDYPEDLTADQMAWRMVGTSGYRQLSSFAVSDIVTVVGREIVPQINVNPTNATFTSYADFEFDVANTLYAEYDSESHKIIAQRKGTAYVTVTHLPTDLTEAFEVSISKSAIIVIPGIMGSELKINSRHGILPAGDKIWPPVDLDNVWQLDSALVAARIKAMEFNDDGTPVYDDVGLYWQGEEPYDARTNFGTDKTYKELNEYLCDTYDSMYEIIFFQYDWRYSNAMSAQKLNEFINQREFENVILIAHSMGGLVASHYLNLGEAQQEKVKKLICLGTPFLGTPSSVEVFCMANAMVDTISDFLNIARSFGIFSNDILVIILNLLGDVANTITTAMANMPSMYELFPTQRFFSSAGKYYIKQIDDSSGDRIPITSYSATKQILAGTGGYNAILMTAAEYRHNSLYDGQQHITDQVDTYYFYSNGVDTTEYIIFNGIYYHSVEENTNHGDGVVLAWSATLGEHNLSRCVDFPYFGHAGNLISSDTVFGAISQKIDDVFT